MDITDDGKYIFFVIGNDNGRVKVRMQHHIASFHTCVAKVRAVESNACLNQVRGKPTGRYRNMTPPSDQVNDLKIDKLYPLFSDELLQRLESSHHLYLPINPLVGLAK
jgi:hypothetical protein